MALKRHRIPTRNIAQAHIRYRRADFSGDMLERSYLLGFAVGDLRVRNHNGAHSETISIGCGSTKPAQIKLIEGLFSQYGRVWKGRPDKRGAINVEAFVNKSFSFLLPDTRDYKWCEKKREHFFSFLAGFTDAEGSLFLSNGKAFIAWGNYDVEVLNFIKTRLKKFGITIPKMHCDSLIGYIGKSGYTRNKQYWHLSCARKNTVKQLLDELEPFTLHSDKKKALVRLRRNLIMRGLPI